MATASPRASAPTVVLVHGAFADSSGWNGVIERLMAAGITAKAVPNPLRGLTEDVAYVTSALQQTEGPVLAVGHSYGGAVITNAASQVDNVVGLVYVAAFAPDEGETLMGIESDSKDSVLTTALLQVRYPTAQGTETEFLIDPAKFHDAFAADVSKQDAAVMAATQRPVSALAFATPTTNPAWKKLPSWAAVAASDKAAGSDVLRSMAQRAGATITEIEGSHVIMVSQPQAVTDVIMQAVEGVSR
ncbi:alpha/beta hydrolase [Micromonospora phytophila]|uniref:alpha/beta fold hydrolase n=1 Tax=Micromonospora phytophila TaxID=709888 RepID=UPI002030B210|nr:alpha/beta hydrolase [Micromonospora phytophila]MCM0676796.1 alpha/beta hydrolase [Micromonospora phytophila]